ncbi:hypothetical protein ACCO45_013733 [Purpureocillium lilacinum]|uniref:Uncharacterized protein n=1 Tax=Purpureocillium lilacinum TaxID=33203 RepID=A0ACC4D905_PURLI
MDEKRQPAGPPRRRPRPKTKLAQAGAAALAICWLSFNLVSNVVPQCHAQPHNGNDDGLLSYPGEHIKWKPCGTVRGRSLECSDIDVPMDQFNASNNHGGKSFSIPLVRLRGRNNATRNLVMNPGGPGGSGFALMYGDGPELSALVDERFHILSFDPRGVNSSRPLASCYPDQATRDAMANPNDGDPERDSPGRYAWTTNYVRACADTLGEHGRYVNTPQTAADMNSILDAVGQESMVYWGLSYGSLLGQTYAQMFPERCERVVVDGVADVFEWYEAPLLLADYTDSQRVLDGFFDECVKAGGRCALASLAGSARELQAKVMAFLDGLKQDPCPSRRPARRLADARRQRDRRLPGLRTRRAARLPPRGRGDRRGRAQRRHRRARALPARTRSPQRPALPLLRDARLRAVAQPHQPRAPAVARPTHARLPPAQRHAHRPPAAGALHDVRPRLPAALGAGRARRLRGARLVEVKAYGHCSLAMPSRCAVGHVRAYLENGTLPERDVKCDADVGYFERPKEGGGGGAEARAVAVNHARGEEDDGGEGVFGRRSWRSRGARLGQAGGRDGTWVLGRGHLPDTSMLE